MNICFKKSLNLTMCWNQVNLFCRDRVIHLYVSWAYMLNVSPFLLVLISQTLITSKCYRYWTWFAPKVLNVHRIQPYFIAKNVKKLFKAIPCFLKYKACLFFMLFCKRHAGLTSQLVMNPKIISESLPNNSEIIYVNLNLHQSPKPQRKRCELWFHLWMADE